MVNTNSKAAPNPLPVTSDDATDQDNMSLVQINDDNHHRNSQDDTLLHTPPVTSSASPAGMTIETMIDETEKPTLSLPLKILFGLNGLSLSLQSLPMMYIINTKVAIPLPLIPTYGAISFLPWSFKPLYAYLTTVTLSDNGFLPTVPRHALLVILLIASAMFVFGTSLIPEGGIILLFLVSFGRAVAEAWAEFCLGLTLIDQANNCYNACTIRTTTTATATSSSFETLAALFQSQAAMSRSTGSLLANIITCILFIIRQMATPNDTQLSGTVAQLLLVTAGVLNLFGSMLAWRYRNNFKSQGEWQENSYSRLDTFHDEEDQVQYGHESGEESTLRDHRMRKIPSYVPCGRQNKYTNSAAMKRKEIDIQDNDSPASIQTTPSNELNELTEMSSTLDPDSDYSMYPTPSSFSRTANITLITILQVALILFTLHHPIATVTSELTWKILIYSSITGLLITGTVAIYYSFALKKSSVSNTDNSIESHDIKDSDQAARLVGFFLILRHAMPSDSMLMGSFSYSIFSSTPLLLQVLSLLGTAISTLSSWSYGKLFSRYSSGGQFRAVVVGTTLLAGIVALSNILLVNYVKKHEDSNINNYIYILFSIALVVKVSTSFTGEWSFLPDVVLATTSVNVDSEEQQRPSYEHQQEGRRETARKRHVEVIDPGDTLRGDCDYKENYSKHEADPNAGEQNRSQDDPQTHQKSVSSSTMAMEYGTFLSCINFGDQLGGLVAGPIVAALGISRENNWSHLGTMIWISSLCSLVPLFFLACLPASRTRQNRQGFN